MRKAGVVAALVFMTACSAAAPAVSQTPNTSPVAKASASPSPAASPTPFAMPSPVTPTPKTPQPVAFGCLSTIPTGAQLELVTLRGSTDIVVRDITNLSKPISRCAFKYCEQFCKSRGPDSIRFVTGSVISYIVRSDNNDGALYLVDLSNQKTVLARTWGPETGYFDWVFAWSPDGNALTYFSSTEWRLRSAAGDVVLSRLGRDLGYNFNSDVDSRTVGFSADGQYVAVDMSINQGVNTIQKASLFKIVRVSDLRLVYSRSDGSMATWAGSGANLYFRTASGLEAWDPINGARLIAPGLGWINPVPNADGTRIAYMLASGNGYHAVREVLLTDQSLHPVTLSTLHRTGIAFLNPTLVWYAEEATCNETPCRCDDAYCEPLLSGKTYVNDLLTGVVSSSLVTSVADVWPHLGTQ